MLKKYVLFTLFSAQFLSLIFPFQSHALGNNRNKGAHAGILAEYGKLPLAFEAWPSAENGQPRYFSRGGGYRVLLTPAGVELALFHPVENSSQSLHDPMDPKFKKPPEMVQDRILMKLIGADQAARADSQGLLPGKSNYFIGNDPKHWLTDVKQYSKVQFKEVYPGIDVVYYGNQGQLEYDFIVKPGADYKQVEWDIQGADDIRLSETGELILKSKGGEIQFKKPVCYAQDSAGLRREINGRYVIRTTRRIGFEVEAVPVGQTLVIDPVLSYSTYLGGSGLTSGYGIDVDSSGNAYVTGFTTGGFPTTSGAYQTTLVLIYDIFVTKLDSTGTTLLYSTYIGGSGYDYGYDIAVDSGGNACVIGVTSGGFPTTSGAFQTAFGGGGYDAFATKLNSTGTALLYSTYLGGSGFDGTTAIAMDSSGNAYVTGQTAGGFPTTSGAKQTVFGGGAYDAFVTKLNSTGTALLYSTYLGGSGDDWGGGIVVNSSGNAYVGGRAAAGFPTTSGVYQTVYGGGTHDAFVANLNSAGTALLYSTYLGGTGDDVASHIALDSSGNACVTGFTEGNFPTTSGAYQTVYGGGTHDVFLTKLNSAGTALLYSTYLGGSGDDLGGDIAVDSTGQVYLIGTASAGFPTTSGVYQIAFSGLVDAFVAKFDMAATAPTSTVTLTPTNTPTISPSFTVSATWSESPTFSPTPTPSATRTSTPTASETKTFTDSPTPSATKTGTGTGTDTHTPSFTRSPTLTRTPTVTGTGTRTATPTVSPFGTSTNSPTITPTHSNTPSFTDSPTPSATKTDSPTATETRTFTPSPTFSQTFTITDTFTIGMTKTPFNENAEIKIKGVYPNPVGAQGAMLVIHTSFQAMATVRIYDLRGELVYKRSDLQIGMGADGQFFWEAKNRGGKPLAYGTYYMKVSAEGGGRSASDGRWISVLR